MLQQEPPQGLLAAAALHAGPVRGAPDEGGRAVPRGGRGAPVPRVGPARAGAVPARTQRGPVRPGAPAVRARPAESAARAPARRAPAPRAPRAAPARAFLRALQQAPGRQ